MRLYLQITGSVALSLVVFAGLDHFVLHQAIQWVVNCYIAGMSGIASGLDKIHQLLKKLET